MRVSPTFALTVKVSVTILHHVVGYTPEERILTSNQLIRESSRYTHKNQSKDGNQRIIQRDAPVQQGWKTVASAQHDATDVPVQQDVSRVEPSRLADSQHDDMEDLVGATAAPSQHKETIADTAQLAAFRPIDKDVTVATFSIEFQNDVDKTPHDRLPSTSIHVLEKISDEAHVDVQSHEVEHRQ